jgi:hypothetical protein
MKTQMAVHLSILSTAGMLLIQFGSALPVQADWNPGEPAKWFQLPDLQNGMDVLATFSVNGNPYHKILADDFLCTQTGPITDIHIWGSWLNDRYPVDPNGTIIPPLFHLSIHSDIPATATSPSRPGDALWSMNLLPTASRIYAQSSERFFDPNVNQIIGFDTQVWQYNFLLSPTEAFSQKEGTTYWLDVQVMPQGGDTAAAPYAFGWKTSSQHWNDWAVFGDNTVFGGPVVPGWGDLRDPATGLPLDMAFVLTTVPEPNGLALGSLGIGLLAILWRRR